VGKRTWGASHAPVLAFWLKINISNQVLVRTYASGTQTYYVYGLGLIGQEQNGEYLTYHFDLRGSPKHVVMLRMLSLAGIVSVWTSSLLLQNDPGLWYRSRM